MAAGLPTNPEGTRSETDSSAALCGLAAELADDPDWIADVSGRISDAIHGELFELERDDELRLATYAGAESNVRQLLEILETGGDPSDAGPTAVIREYTAEYVRRGVTVETLLRAYQLGQAILLHELSGRVRAAVTDRDEISLVLEQTAERTLAYINAMIGDLIGRYARERDRWVRSSAAVRAETTEALLAGGQIDLQAAEQRLGYPLDRTHRAFVFWSSQTGDMEDIGALESAASEFAAQLGGKSRLLVRIGPLLVAGWVSGIDEGGAGPPPRIPAETVARAAIGEPGSGIDGFGRSHREAMQARRIAELTARPPGSVVAYGDVALTALASSDLDHARDFVDRQLGALAAADDDTVRLSATLRVYLEERSSPRRTAERLGVHANTVTNRVRAAQELLGEPIEGRIAELLVALRLAQVVSRTGAARRDQSSGRSGWASAEAIAR